MRCHCCESEVAKARKVKICVVPAVDVPQPSRGDPAFLGYLLQTTYLPGFVCQACYSRLDNDHGEAKIGNRLFSIKGPSRLGRAPTVGQAAYDAFQRREAARRQCSGGRPGLTSPPDAHEEG